MADVMERVLDAVVGLILLVVAGTVYTQFNSDDFGGTLPYTIAGFVPTALGVGILVRAFKG